MSLSPLLFNTTRSQINAVRQKKEIKGILTKKKKIKVFADEIFLHRKPKGNPQKNLLELISNYSKIAKCKVKIHESIIFLHAISEHVEFEIKNTYHSH